MSYLFCPAEDSIVSCLFFLLQPAAECPIFPLFPIKACIIGKWFSGKTALCQKMAKRESFYFRDISTLVIIERIFPSSIILAIKFHKQTICFKLIFQFVQFLFCVPPASLSFDPSSLPSKSITWTTRLTDLPMLVRLKYS